MHPEASEKKYLNEKTYHREKKIQNFVNRKNLTPAKKMHFFGPKNLPPEKKFRICFRAVGFFGQNKFQNFFRGVGFFGQNLFSEFVFGW